MILKIVVPCYNEESLLHEASHQFNTLLQRLINIGKVSDESHVVFVDDGSLDKTWPINESLSQCHTLINGIKLSKNRVHQNAVLTVHR